MTRFMVTGRILVSAAGVRALSLIIRGTMDRQSYLTLQLVRLCKVYQRKAMARDTVLGCVVERWTRDSSSADTASREPTQPY